MGEFAKIAKKRKAADWSWGLAARSGDLVLLMLHWFMYFPMTANRVKFWRQIESHDYRPLDETKIRNLVYQLKHRGFVDYAKRMWQDPVITAQGKKRLREILPTYDDKRAWDGHLYLVTYDIFVKQNYLRDQLRRILKTLGCGMLQGSVWLTPYTPQNILQEFAAKHNLVGQILVSDLGKGGSIGEEDNRGLVARVYKLNELNLRYEEFLKRWHGKEPKPEMLSHFFSILKDDPQLPFELLPNDWQGEKAWELISPHTKS